MLSNLGKKGEALMRKILRCPELNYSRPEGERDMGN